jgi:hypothetical protein
MRFLAPDLRNNDRVWIGRWNALVASVCSILLHSSSESLRTTQRHRRGRNPCTSMPMIRAHLQYSAIVHGKELPHE